MKYIARLIAAAVACLYLAAIACNASGAEAFDIVVKDGDTFACKLRLEFGIVIDDREDVRVMAYDAWETSYRRQTIRYAPDEIERGRAAKDALVKLLGGAKTVQVLEVAGKRDPYGRKLLWVYVDGKEIGSILRAQGHERHD